MIAYLQSLGGTPSVTMSTELKYQSAEGAQPVTAPAADEGDADKGPQSAKDIFANYGCAACHTVDAPTPGVGPSLYDIGQRMSKGELYEALMDPDAVIAEGFAPGMMGAMLGGNGFYTQVSSNELKGLVDYLSELTGEAK